MVVCVRVERAVRLQTGPRVSSSPRHRRVTIPPAVRAAAGTGLAALVCILLLLSPSLAVRTVLWTGVVGPPEPRCQEFEAASLGKPLMLLSHSYLEELLQVDSQRLRVHFKRHLPGTLEVVVLPRFAVWVTSRGEVLDGQGAQLDSTHAVPGLQELDGFALDATHGGLTVVDVQALSLLREAVLETGLDVTVVARRGDDLVLTLSPSRRQVWLSARHLQSGLHKLRMLYRRLDVESLPSHVDLRFRDQIVLASGSREVRHGKP